jgi:YgiT-type zinc finger domain-containing protein
MICRVCGADMHSITTDLPFKITDRAIVIIKELPVRQCERCTEYLLDDATMARGRVARECGQFCRTGDHPVRGVNGMAVFSAGCYAA